MGEASKIALNAIGKQDTHLLSKDPDESFFQSTNRMLRHSNFRKMHRVLNVVNSGRVQKWPFGQSVKVKYDPQNMGDLLSNMYLSITMPGLSDGNYADQLGRHIIKSVTMFVDDIEVEKLYDDWGIIYDELYLEVSEKVANRFLVNRSLGYDDATDSDSVASYSSDLMIPLHFFFTRKYASDEYSSNKPNRPYFPVCAIHKQKIEFEFEFHTQLFFTDTTDSLELSEFKIITEEITLEANERNYLTSIPQTFITDIVKKHPSTESILNEPRLTTNLVPNIPVKCFHWFLRNTQFENLELATGDPVPTDEEQYLCQNRFNFSSSSNFDEIDTFFNPIMRSASFYIKGERLPNVSNTLHNYYKYLIPFRNRLARPFRNIYTYSFSMNPINVEPSGNLDFSQIQSDKTKIEIEFDETKATLSTNTYTLHMYYTGYQTFKFENGFMSIPY